MSVKNASGRSHYFVPLGRERGGYLDFLGLPPDAKVGEVGRKQTEYLKSLEATLKKARKVLRTARDEEKTISPQEFEVKTKELEDERTKNEQKLNELRAKFDAVQAEKRGARGTSQREEAIWLEMYRGFGSDPKELWSFLLRPRPLPNVPLDLLLEIEQRWIGPHVKGQRNVPQAGSAVSYLASQNCPNNKPVDLTTLAALVTERDLICMLAADAIWSEIQYTNRERWRDLIEQWAEEVAALGPRLLHDASGPAPTDYPDLHRPTKLMIENLEAEEFGEIAHAPQRGTGQRESDFEALLADLLARERGSDGTPYADSETSDAPDMLLEPSQLEELLAYLQRANQGEAD